ncbi:proteinase-activated receptor 4-like [Brienomyrus brachyistius]|uniref:proteinase-activated receptor 4-like n=1 Tax=Brienomyrus brachyistius TaxID=42636 RepID=UPI0020B34CC2|nr:proteinase-activated receptor 4-like [Brienomyrus brachyistius]
MTSHVVITDNPMNSNVNLDNLMNNNVIPDNPMNSNVIPDNLMNSNVIPHNPMNNNVIPHHQTISIFILVSDEDKLEIQSRTTVIVVPVLYLITFLVGLPANILALWVLIFHTEKIPSTILLINLTVLDVLLFLMLPFRIIYYFAGLNWFFGEPMCRLVIALLYGSMYGSVLTLAFISIDRYIALVHPYSALTLRSHRTSLAMSVSVWVVVLLAMLPLLLFRQSYPLSNPPITTCHDAQLEPLMTTFFFPYYTSLFSICFLLPLLVIVFCHGSVLKTLLASGHRYSHAACLTALVLLVFLACVLPSNILLLLQCIGKKHNLNVPYIVSLAFSCFGPCIDPFIYNYVSDEFRGKVLRVLCCHRAEQQVSPNNCDIHLTSSSQSQSTDENVPGGVMQNKSKVILHGKFKTCLKDVIVG